MLFFWVQFPKLCLFQNPFEQEEKEEYNDVNEECNDENVCDEIDDYGNCIINNNDDVEDMKIDCIENGYERNQYQYQLLISMNNKRRHTDSIVQQQHISNNINQSLFLKQRRIHTV